MPNATDMQTLTVNDVIRELQALPPEARELPLVASMWDKGLEDFHALGDVKRIYYEGGEFVQAMGYDPQQEAT